MTPSGAERARFVAAVAARLGLRVDLERAGELIERRAAAHLEPVAEYLDRLEIPDRAEISVLASALTVGETYFLRHIEQFRAFAELVAPDRLARGRLNVLSAGCSSGEEPYTVAMLLRESRPATAFAIHAVDVDAEAIARARAGRYTRWSLRAVSPAFERRWFRRDGADVVVAPEIRGAVRFEHANLLDGGALEVPGQWDVVFCRNVLMYFTDGQAATVIARIARALAPGGYLFLGHAEALHDHGAEFALCHSHGAFYYQRYPATPAPDAGHAQVAVDGPDGRAGGGDAGWYDDIHAAAQRVHAMVDVALDRAYADGAAGTAPAPPDLEAIRELLAQERFGEALAGLDQLGGELAGDRDVAMLRALVLTHAGRFAEARAACAAVLHLDAGSAGASYLLALCCESTGDTAGAAHLAEVAAGLDPSFAMPHVHLGLLARRLGDRARASRELVRAIALLEQEPPARLALYGGGFSRQALLDMCGAELAAIGARR